MTGAVVLDCSAAAILLGDATGATAAVIAGVQYAPELIDLEIANVLRKLVARGQLSADSADRAITEWAANSVVRCGHTRFLPQIWQLRGSITPYDAAYVTLAAHLDVPLVTADRRLAAAAAPFCEVIVVAD